jgi:hypothetical protein
METETAPVATRSYVKRVRKFDLKTQNAIASSIKAIGVVATAEKFNTLYVYVAKLAKARKITVNRGRRPGTKLAA